MGGWSGEGSGPWSGGRSGELLRGRELGRRAVRAVSGGANCWQAHGQSDGKLDGRWEGVFRCHGGVWHGVLYLAVPPWRRDTAHGVVLRWGGAALGRKHRTMVNSGPPLVGLRMTSAE